MRQTVGRVLANPVVRTAIMTAISNVIQLYAKAFTNVIKRKIENLVVVDKEKEPRVLEGTLED